MAMLKKNRSLLVSSLCALPLAFPLTLLSASVWAGQPSPADTAAPVASATVLMAGDAFQVTAEDVRADALRIPEQSRAQLLSKPQTVEQIANNLYIRRGLAAQAQAQGLADSPVVQAALQIARDKVLSDALLDRIDARSEVGDAEAEKMALSTYRAHPDRFKTGERVKVRHILIKGEDDEARQKAQELLQALHKGGDFAALAKEHSQDTGSAVRGGELGWFPHGAMVPEFDKAAFALEKKGDLSGLVKTQFGFHILQLQDRQPAGIKPFEEVRGELMKSLKASVQQDARRDAAQKVQATGKPQAEAIKALAEQFETAAKKP